ncbi:hypothetical protein KAR48_07335 [bacterium]|nr:hypothetical protein [bacterium]
MTKFPFIKDERQHAAFLKISAAMYFINLILLMILIFIRQFILHQPVSQFEDMAILMTFNAIFFLIMLFYFSGITLPVLSLKSILTFYAAFVLLGSLFTIIKYFVLMDTTWSFSFILGKFVIIAAICALFTGIYALFAYLGYRRMEKTIAE